MAFLGLFRQCTVCGKNKFVLSLNDKGQCSDCVAPESPTQHITTHSCAQSVHSPDPLETTIRYGVYADNICNGCAMVYRYPNVSVSNVNSNVLRSMVIAKDYKVSLNVSDHGDILLIKNGETVATLGDMVQMCKDWLKKGRPLICEFAVFNPGKEKVALFFYRAESDEMANKHFEVTKLTSCFSSSKQETISLLLDGEKLFVDMDDNDKPYIRDIEYNPIGNLPAKYKRFYEEDLILGIYFDHSETLKAEDWDKEDKEIPYVRIYISEL